MPRLPVRFMDLQFSSEFLFYFTRTFPYAAASLVNLIGIRNIYPIQLKGLSLLVISTCTLAGSTPYLADFLDSVLHPKPNINHHN
ncbi:hypothetical protein F4678DRAFT_260259 [Xylaria arbuscula]|nr:hypothetical protein F4678DRAFT_260259 [Xylaria arbuscula]